MKRPSLIAVIVLGLMVVASDASAIIGRPLTPMSYAGVARRTTRRTVRRTAYAGAAYAGAATAATVAALPPGCGPYGGDYRCGGNVYRPAYQGTSVVYIVNP
jgi:hypothetical protein